MIKLKDRSNINLPSHSSFFKAITVYTNPITIESVNNTELFILNVFSVKNYDL